MALPPAPIHLPWLILLLCSAVSLWISPSLDLGAVAAWLAEIVLWWVVTYIGQRRRGFWLWLGAFLLLPSLVALFLALGVPVWPEKIRILTLGTSWILGKWKALQAALWPKGPFWEWLSDRIHPNLIGFLLTPVWPVMLGLWISAWRFPGQKQGIHLRRLVGWVLYWAGLGELLGLTSLLLVLAQPRAAWLGIAVGLVFAWWVNSPSWRSGALRLGVVGGLAWWACLKGQTFFLHFWSDLTRTGSVVGRAYIWSAALYVLQAAPWTGIGFHQFHRWVKVLFPAPMYPFGSETYYVYAHNTLLQTALDLGLVGLVAYLGLQGAAGWMWLHVWRRRGWVAQRLGVPKEVVLGLGAALVGSWVYGLFESTSPGIDVLPFGVILLIQSLFLRLVRGAKGGYRQ